MIFFKKKNKKVLSNQCRGRPSHDDPYTKCTVVLMDDHIFWLDRLSTNYRFKTKQCLSRSEIIRALITSAKESSNELDILKNL